MIVYTMPYNWIMLPNKSWMWAHRNSETGESCLMVTDFDGKKTQISITLPTGKTISIEQNTRTDAYFAVKSMYHQENIEHQYFELLVALTAWPAPGGVQITSDCSGNVLGITYG